MAAWACPLQAAVHAVGIHTMQLLIPDTLSTADADSAVALQDAYLMHWPIATDDDLTPIPQPPIEVSSPSALSPVMHLSLDALCCTL